MDEMREFAAQLPLVANGEALSEVALLALPRAEQAVMGKLRGDGGPSAQFWQKFELLRMEGFGWKQAAIGAWHATGRRNRGKYTSAQGFAHDVLGISRQALHKQIADGTALRLAADKLLAEFWRDKVADVDQATYERAVSVGGQASDRKLAYQRAEVALNERLITPDANANGVDPWAQLALAGEKAITN
jgi:hypothetical protein